MGVGLTHLKKARSVGVAAAATSLAVAVAGVAPAQAADLTPPALSLTADNSVWGTNGRVMEIETYGSRALLGGGFDYVGPTVGHSALVDASTGALAESPKMTIDNVNAVISDGAGGYYLGGEFTLVDGAPKRRVAHIGADGKVDRGFKAQTNGKVYALALSPTGVLYIGGKITKVSGAAATNLAAVDATTGDPVPGWSASPNSTVYALAATATSVYVGGAFSTVGVSHRGIARLNASNGSLDTSFTSTTGSTVRALALSADGSTVYAGGDFTSAYSSPTGTQSRSRLAAFATSNGAVTGWNPGADAVVSALVTDGATGTVYAGGQFTTLGGVARTSLGGVTAAGATSGWNPAITGCHEPHLKKAVGGLAPCVPWTTALAIADGVLYAGGNFKDANGVSRHHAASWQTATGDLTAWNPVVGNKVLGIASTPSGIVLGGEFTSVGGLLRDGLAVIDLTTGQADPGFRSDVDGMVLDITKTADGTGAYVAGDFINVNGQDHRNIVKISAATGAVDSRLHGQAEPRRLADVARRQLPLHRREVQAGGHDQAGPRRQARRDDRRGRPGLGGRHRRTDRQAPGGRHGHGDPGDPGRLQGVHRRPVHHGQRRRCHRRDRRRRRDHRSVHGQPDRWCPGL